MKNFKTKNGIFTGKVGIGTTNPDTLLEVSASSNVVAGGSDPVAVRIGHTNQDGGNDSYSLVDDVCQLQFYSADASHASATGGVRASIGMISEGLAGGSMGLSFGTNDAERVRIDSAGNVGIGTTSPKTSLEVNSGNTNSVAQFVSSDAGANIAFKDNTTSTDAGIGTTAIGATGDDLIMYTNNGEKMRIDSAGNVGIGTTSPNANLSIVSPTIDTDVIPLVLSTADPSVSLNQECSIGFGQADKTFAKISSYYAGSSGSGGFGLKMYTGGNVGSGNDRTQTNPSLTIDQDGKVGIGISSPQETLHINHSTAPKIRFERENSFSWDIGHTSSNFQFESQGYGSVLHLGFGGNVGIGTTLPGAYKLAVSGSQAEFIQVIENDHTSSAYGLYLTFAANHDNTTSEFIRCNSGGNINFKVYSNGTIYADGSSLGSDDRIKHNEEKIVNAVETLSKITPKKYFKTTKLYDANHDFDLDSDGQPIDENSEPVNHRVEAGVIAQEVLEVDELKFAVTPETIDEDGNVTTPYALNYNSLFTYAIAAIQEQQLIIEDLKDNSENQSSVVDDLISRIKTLENK